MRRIDTNRIIRLSTPTIEEIRLNYYTRTNVLYHRASYITELATFSWYYSFLYNSISF
jgi:hypothetical protein